MSEQEMLNKIKALEEENERLKGMTSNKPYSILAALGCQKELDFMFPYYHNIMKKWKRSSVTTEFTPLRKVAMSVVNTVNSNNYFTEQKVKDLSEEDFNRVVACADEIAKVVAKHKKEYLLAAGRKDIIDAFGM